MYLRWTWKFCIWKLIQKAFMILGTLFPMTGFCPLPFPDRLFTQMTFDISGTTACCQTAWKEEPKSYHRSHYYYPNVDWQFQMSPRIDSWKNVNKQLIFVQNDVSVLVEDGTGTLDLGFGYLQYHGEMGWKQVEQGFSSFFLPYLMMLQSFTAPSEHSTLKHLQNWQKIKKSLVQLALKIHFFLMFSTHKSNFWYLHSSWY